MTMMSSLFEKRVEAGAEGMWNRYGSRGMFVHAPEHRREAFKADARAALAAADAVVTEEELERVLSGAFQGWTDQDDPFGDQARAILALFRGGAK